MTAVSCRPPALLGVVLETTGTVWLRDGELGHRRASCPAQRQAVRRCAWQRSVAREGLVRCARHGADRGRTPSRAAARALTCPLACAPRFLNNVGFFFPLIMMLAWLVSVASMVRQLVYEREIQLEGVSSPRAHPRGGSSAAPLLSRSRVSGRGSDTRQCGAGAPSRRRR